MLASICSWILFLCSLLLLKSSDCFLRSSSKASSLALTSVYCFSNGLRSSSYFLILASKLLILSSTLNSATDFSTLSRVFLACLSLEISLSNCFSSLTLTPASIFFSNWLIWESMSLTLETGSFCLALRSSSFFLIKNYIIINNKI